MRVFCAAHPGSPIRLHCGPLAPVLRLE
jgi:hypothetical protein